MVPGSWQVSLVPIMAGQVMATYIFSRLCRAPPGGSEHPKGQDCFTLKLIHPTPQVDLFKDTQDQYLKNECLARPSWLVPLVNTGESCPYLVQVLLPHGLSVISDKLIPAMDQPALGHCHL